MEPVRNEYLDQVMAQQQRLQADLKARTRGDAATARRDLGQAAGALGVRVTGFWRFRTVVVPPNVYVVHTRRGHAEPLHVGLGISFRFDPVTDAFLVVPSAMQTILVSAHCICAELQGVVVQGYVQWIVSDFATAYRKLDFTDAEDPMRVVNLQLREQAEAVIKDKVATMGIAEVLSDKQPIIDELSARLRALAEGEGTDKALGLRIVTVQIKEAVVSSTRLWENLQKPYRAEQERKASLAELAAQAEVQVRRTAVQKEQDRLDIETRSEVEELRARKAADAFDREQGESLRRTQREEDVGRQLASERQATALHRTGLDRDQLTAEGALARARLQEETEQRRLAAEAAIALDEARWAAANRQAAADVELLQARERVLDQITPASLQARLIDALPDVADKLPRPAELRVVSLGADAGPHGGQALSSLVAQLLSIVDALRRPPVGP